MFNCLNNTQLSENQSVTLFRTHFLLNLLKNASFPTRLPIFVRILTRATCLCACAHVYN